MSQALEDVTNTVDATGIGVASGENGSELVIDVAGIVETPTSLDESTTTTTTEAADFTTDPPFDPSANTDAGIEPRTVEPATETTTDAAPEQAEPGNDVAEEGDDDPDEPDFGMAISDDGEVLQSGMDVRAHREYERRRNAAQSRVADAYLSMVSAKVEAKAAADHLTSEGEALEKIVAGGWRAIKREMEAAGRAAGMYQDAALEASTKAGSIASVVEATAAIAAHVTAGDSIYGDSATLDAQAPSEAVSDAWRDCTIAELGAHGLRSSLVNRLAELGFDTIGKLEDLRAKISTGAVDRWPKGIGEAKITEIENAVVGWLTANRDAGVFGAIPTTEGDTEEVEEVGQDSASDANDPRYPTMEQWDKLTADQKKDWFGSRCENLGTLKSIEFEKAFDAGRDAWHAGKNVDACEYYPGARCDDWLRGWVTGSMEPQRVKEAAVKPSTSVDDLFG